jgi:hypothetical protein
MRFLPGSKRFARGDKPCRPTVSAAKAARPQALEHSGVIAARVSWKSAEPSIALRRLVASSILVWQIPAWHNCGVNHARLARSEVRGERKNCNPQAEREQIVDGLQHCSVSVRHCWGKQESQIPEMCFGGQWMIQPALLVTKPPRASGASGASGAGEGPARSSIRQDSAPEKSFPRSRSPGG